MNNGSVETFEVRGYTVKIYQDTDAESPRESDNVGTMACFHSRYNLGDAPYRRGGSDEFLEELAEDVDPGITDRWDNLHFSRMVPAPYPNPAYKQQRAAWQEKRNEAIWKAIDSHYVLIPLALLDHSGLHIWCGSGPHWSDSAGWDSGQVGWVYCTKERAVKEWGKRRFTKKVREMADKCLRQEVETYDQFLRGDVYGYQITDPDGKDTDSCWGMFGFEYCKTEATAAVPDEPALSGGEAEDEAHEAVLP